MSDIPEKDDFLNREIKLETDIVVVDLIDDSSVPSPEESEKLNDLILENAISPGKPKRKYVRKSKPEGIDNELKPKRKYSRKSKSEKSVNEESLTKALDLSPSKDSINSSDFTNSSMHYSESSSHSCESVIVRCHSTSTPIPGATTATSDCPSTPREVKTKPKGTRSVTRKKKTNDVIPVDSNGSKEGHGLIKSESIDPQTQLQSSQILNETEIFPEVKDPGNNIKTEGQTKQLGKAKQTNARKKVVRAVILDTSMTSSSISMSHSPSMTDPNVGVNVDGTSQDAEAKSVLSSQDITDISSNSNANKIVNVLREISFKPRRVTPRRTTQLITFSEMPPMMPMEVDQRKKPKAVSKRTPRGVKRKDEKEKRRCSQTPQPETITTTATPIPTTDTANILESMPPTSVSVVGVDRDLSEIDGDDTDSQFWEKDSSGQHVPFTAEVELNVVTVIDQVSKGEGEINPNPVVFPRHQRTPNPTVRRSNRVPAPRRPSVSIRSSESLIELEAEERVPVFQDYADHFSLAMENGNCNSGESEHSGNEDDEPPVVYNANTCSICRWKIRPTTETEMEESYPRRKNHKFSYTIVEKNELYADGQFLMDEYVIEKNREDQVLWRVVDSCMCVQRFDPYEANGRVFHHGTEHYHFFSYKDREFYQRFQPVYAISIMDTKDYQFAIFVAVERLLPCLGMISKTDDLFDAYKVLIQMMISENLERKFIQNQLKSDDGDIYFSQNWEKIASEINNRTNEIMNAEFWAPGTFNLLANFPRLVYSRLVGDEKVQCTTCRHRDRKVVFTIRFYGGPYDTETFEPLPVPEIPGSGCKICYYCQPLIKSFIRIYHHRYLLFCCIQKNISNQLTELKKDEKYEVFQLLEFMMDDHEWILNMFLEFQVVLAEADKSISQIVTDPNKPAKIRNFRKTKK